MDKVTNVNVKSQLDRHWLLITGENYFIKLRTWMIGWIDHGDEYFELATYFKNYKEN